MGDTAMAMSSLFQAGGSIVNGVQQSSALRQQGDYQKMMADANSRLETIKAQDATSRGEVAAATVSRETQQRVGAQRAAMAAQGVDVNSGSSAKVQASTEGVGALSVLTIKNNAWREAWGYRVQSSNDAFEGQMKKNAADNAANNTLLAGGLNAASSFAKGANYADKGGLFDSDLFTMWDDGGTLTSK